MNFIGKFRVQRIIFFPVWKNFSKSDSDHRDIYKAGDTLPECSKKQHLLLSIALLHSGLQMYWDSLSSDALGLSTSCLGMSGLCREYHRDIIIFCMPARRKRPREAPQERIFANGILIQSGQDALCNSHCVYVSSNFKHKDNICEKIVSCIFHMKGIKHEQKQSYK